MPQRGTARRGHQDESDPDDRAPHDPGSTADGRAPVDSDVALLGDSLPLGVISASGMGTAVYANEAASELLGRAEKALLGWGWEAAIHPEDRPELFAAVAVVLDSGARQRVLVRLAEEPDRWLEMTFAALGPRNAPSGWIATLDEVSERVQTERLLAHQATHDPLTRLPNRALLEDRLRTAGLRLPRAGADASVAVMFCDVDDFKEINDRHGHVAGDAVLVEVARRMTRAVRASDTVARWGGDEFVAVCELARTDDATLLVARLGQALNRPVRVRDDVVALRVSIGVVVASDPLPDLEQLMATADSRMYEAKAERKRHRSS